MKQQWKAIVSSVAAVIAVAIVFGGISWMLNRDKLASPHPAGVTIPRPPPSPAMSVPLATVPPVEPVPAKPIASAVVKITPAPVVARIVAPPSPVPSAPVQSVRRTATVQLEVEEPRKYKPPPQLLVTNVPLAGLMGPHPPIYARGQTMAFFKLTAPEPVTNDDLVPPDPFMVASSDADLTEWLQRWADGIRHGTRPAGLHQLDLPELLKRTPLKAVQLYRIGQGLEFVDEASAAFPFWNAAIEKADQEMKDHVPGDPADGPVFHALINMGGLFDTRQFTSVIRIHRLMKAHLPANSVLAIRAEICEAWAFLEAGRNDSQADLLESASVLRGILERPETQKLSPAEQGFIHWQLGYALFNVSRADEALEHLEFAVGVEKQPYTERARSVYLLALVRTGQVDELKKQYELWVERTRPTTEQAAVMADSYHKMEDQAAYIARINGRAIR